jgi:hypothetical protein
LMGSPRPLWPVIRVSLQSEAKHLGRPGNRRHTQVGPGGVGKTHIIKAIKHKLGERCLIVAPTGVAAMNAGGNTIHFMFKLDNGIQDIRWDKKRGCQFPRNKLVSRASVPPRDRLPPPRAPFFRWIRIALSWVRDGRW